MKKLNRFIWFLLLIGLAGGMTGEAQQQPWSVRAASSAINRWPSGNFSPAGAPPAWTHSQGVLLEGIRAVWRNTLDQRNFVYIEHSVDPLVGPDGSLPALKSIENRLGNAQLGGQLLLLYSESRNERYFNAATALYDQLQHQPRNTLGGFWTAQNDPNQMTLDNIDEAEPFYAEYARTFHHPEAFADITKQFVLIQDHARDRRTGLLRQAWDVSKQAPWANKQTGDSHENWARGMGWYMVALVDTIPFYSEDAPGRKRLVDILNQDAAAVARYQDADTGLWDEVMDKGNAKGNFLESSASCTFVYALAKGVRLGYLPERYSAVAERGYKGILTHFVTTGADGEVSLSGTVEPTDLGGDPLHNGSYAFYIGQKTVNNSPMGMGAFILASTEIENMRKTKIGGGTQ
jgi:unsaturated rhamnogalacturonyl hydrolase